MPRRDDYEIPEVTKSEMDTFRANVRRLVSAWTHRTGKTQRELAVILFPNKDPDAAFRWLRRAIASGYVPKGREQVVTVKGGLRSLGETKKNVAETKRLHWFFGLKYGELWRSPCRTPADRLAELCESMHPSWLTAFRHQIDQWAAYDLTVDSALLQSVQRIVQRVRAELPAEWRRMTESGRTEVEVIKAGVEELKASNDATALYEALTWTLKEKHGAPVMQEPTEAESEPKAAEMKRRAARAAAIRAAVRATVAINPTLVAAADAPYADLDKVSDDVLIEASRDRELNSPEDIKAILLAVIGHNQRPVARPKLPGSRHDMK